MNEAQKLRQERLCALLAGDRHADEPEVQAWLLADPTLRDELAALQATAAVVAADAAREKRLLAEAAQLAARGPAAVGPAAVVPAVPAPLGRLRRGWFGGLLLAAAALVVAYLAWPDQDPPVRPDDQRVLSGGPLVIGEPEPTADGGLRLVWRASRPGATFDAVIFDPAQGRNQPRLERAEAEADSSSWTLTRDEVAELPKGSRLWVEARWPERTVDQERIIR